MATGEGHTVEHYMKEVLTFTAALMALAARCRSRNQRISARAKATK